MHQRPSLLLEAGQRLVGIGQWQECPLPYGAQPRLVLYHLCSEAVRTQSNLVDVGGSVRGFLQRVGISFGGKEFNRFKEQMTALSCCRMTLAYVAPDGRVSQMQATPIDSFDAWLGVGAWICRKLSNFNDLRETQIFEIYCIFNGLAYPCTNALKSTTSAPDHERRRQTARAQHDSCAMQLG